MSCAVEKKGRMNPDRWLPRFWPDTLGNRYRGTLQLENAERYSVDVEDDVGPLGVFRDNGHLLGDAEMVVCGVFPVD